MSKYTTELRFICESLSGRKEQGNYKSIDEAIEISRPKIFDFNYTLFDETYKPIIETKFLKHYYTREIGLETYSLWKLKLEDKINMIIPYYNKLWASENLVVNPLWDTDLTRTHTKDNDGTSANTGNVKFDNLTETNDDSIRKYSDTPQGDLNGVIDSNYLTNVTQDNNDGVTLNSGTTVNDLKTTVKNSEEYFERVYGKTGGVSYGELLVKWRDSFLKIDAMFINEFSDLFMLLW